MFRVPSLAQHPPLPHVYVAGYLIGDRNSTHPSLVDTSLHRYSQTAVFTTYTSSIMQPPHAGQIRCIISDVQVANDWMICIISPTLPIRFRDTSSCVIVSVCSQTWRCPHLQHCCKLDWCTSFLPRHSSRAQRHQIQILGKRLTHNC